MAVREHETCAPHRRTGKTDCCCCHPRILKCEDIAGPLEALQAFARSPNGPMYQPKRKNDNPEARVNQAVREWLTLHKVFYFRVNTMGTPMQGGGFRPASTTGISDFIAVHNGRILCLEAKSDVGRQSEAQKTFQASVEAAGGFYAVIRSIDDLERLIKPLLK